MSTITLKTAKRDTQVTRLKIRAAIEAVYSKKGVGDMNGKNVNRTNSKSEPIRFAKAAKK